MSHEIRIYVPDAVPDSVPDAVKRELAREYGGFTCYHTDGGWIDDDGELIEEPVTVISAVTDAPRDALTRHARRLATHVHASTSEDAVLWQITHSNHGLVANSD